MDSKALIGHLTTLTIVVVAVVIGNAISDKVVTKMMKTDKPV